MPLEGAAVLCPNHLSFFDSVAIMFAMDRPVHFIGKSDYLDSWKTRWLFPAMGMIPIDRDNGAKAMLALDAAAEVLRDGALLVVYPEGTRSRDGHLHRGYIGAARLALSVGCPIFPVGVVGTRHIQPPGARLPRPGLACLIAVGAPMMPTEVEPNNRRSAARALTNQLMERIAELSGQRYVPQYSQRPQPASTIASRTRQHAGIGGYLVPVPAA